MYLFQWFIFGAALLYIAPSSAEATAEKAFGGPILGTASVGRDQWNGLAGGRGYYEFDNGVIFGGAAMVFSLTDPLAPEGQVPAEMGHTISGFILGKSFYPEEGDFSFKADMMIGFGGLAEDQLYLGGYHVFMPGFEINYQILDFLRIGLFLNYRMASVSFDSQQLGRVLPNMSGMNTGLAFDFGGSF